MLLVPMLAAVTLNLSPVFGITGGGWVLPDGPLDCALLGATLCLVHALERGALQFTGNRAVDGTSTASSGPTTSGAPWRCSSRPWPSRPTIP